MSPKRKDQFSLDQQTRPSDDLLNLALQAIHETIHSGQPVRALPENLANHAQLQHLLADLQALHQFAQAVAHGDLDHALRLKGHLAGSLKSLQANLRHLTWQTQQIAKGDFSQRVEFLGEFSTAFNSMVTALAETRAQLERREAELSQANAELLQEITERKHAEEVLHTHQIELELQNEELRTAKLLLEASQQQYADLYDFAPVGYCTLDRDGRITETNLTAATLLGVERERLINTRLYQYLIETDRDILFRHLRTLSHTRTQQTCELRLIKPDGSLFHVQLETIGSEERPDQADWYHTALSDITARKEVEAALLNAHNELSEKNEQLRELNASKDKFFSIIAHDLRSPFTSLLGFLELMSKQFDDLSPDKLKDYLAKVRLSADRLYALLENLLTWSRLQRDLITWTPTNFNLREIIEDLLMLFLDNAERKQITLTSSVPEVMFVYADQDMVNAVMRNLISNALKFTPTGGRIMLSAQRAARDVEVAISDTGSGMSIEVMANLFRIDAQYTTIGTVGETGTGLGLILCQDLVRKNGGKIWVESNVRKGTTFRFTLQTASSAEVVTHKDGRRAGMEEAECQILNCDVGISAPVIVPPSAEQLAALLDLAEIGDILAIQQQCDELVQHDPRLYPFAAELKRFAQGFQMKQMRTFLSAYARNP